MVAVRAITALSLDGEQVRERVRPTEPAVRKSQDLAPGREGATTARKHNRHDGVMYILAVLDLATGKISTESVAVSATAISSICSRHYEHADPREAFVVCDDFSPHRHPEVRAWCAENQVELVS